MTFSPSKYLDEIKESLAGNEDSFIGTVETIREVFKNGKTIWILGNGGSLAIAQHFAQDLLKMRGIKARTLNCPSVITAYSNDRDFEDCYYGPLKILWENGDLIIIFSCSGNSRNYLDISSHGFDKLIAIVGTDGGVLKNTADICIHAKSENYQICETAFCVIADLINIELGEKEDA